MTKRTEPPADPSTFPAELRPAGVEYARRWEQAGKALHTLDKASARVANLRGVTFLLACLVGGLAVFDRVPPGTGWAVVPLLGFYVALVVRHSRLSRQEEQARVRVELNERALGRLSGAWRRFPGRGDGYLTSEHLYAPDLDLFGQGSLFQLVDETATVDGERQLAQWLEAPAAPAEVRARQEMVRELVPLLDFRQALVVECRGAAAEKADLGQFIAWAEGPSGLEKIRWVRPLAVVVPLLTLLLYVASQVGWLPGWAWYPSLLAQLTLAGATMKVLSREWERLSAGEGGFSRFESTFALVEAQRFSHPGLEGLRSGLQPPGEPRLSARFRQFTRRFAFAEVRRSGQLFAILHLATLWDVHTAFALDEWRRRHGAGVRRWFDALAQLEALGALATYAHARPHHAWPTVVEGGPVLEAAGLGHPLLDAPVRNDVSLGRGVQGLLITGSNMSGKTTLLRALGLNAVLAQAGLPVCALAMTASPLQVLTSMRVKDSLERGVSYFYAEVQRIKRVLDAAQAARGQALFLIDELLLGTNTRERQIASREVLRLLLGSGAIGGVTTHDLALTSLAGSPGFPLANVHFRDRLEGGEMAFDYRLREGVVDTTNALRVMQRAGIAIPEGVAE